jgi:hypothetical protein
MARKSKNSQPTAAEQIAAAWDAANPELAPASLPEPVAVAEPVAKLPKLSTDEKRAARIASDAAIRAEGKVVYRANGKPSARGLTCLCGCDQPTHTDEAWFLSGHDAILRREVLRKGEPLPEIVRPFYETGLTIAGMVLVDGEITDVKKGGPEF